MEDSGFARNQMDGQANPVNIERGRPWRQVSLSLRFETMAVPDTRGVQID
jgi:hypothetical protein